MLKFSHELFVPLTGMYFDHSLNQVYDFSVLYKSILGFTLVASALKFHHYNMSV